MSKDKKEAKFGIEHFAKHIGVAPASARDKLRRANLSPKEGKYGWDSVEDMEATAAKLKKPDSKKAAKPAAKASKPAKTSKKKAAA